MSNTRKLLTKSLDMKDGRIQEALKLVFAGRLSQAEIAKKCDVSPRTVWTWTQHPDFITALDDLRKDFRKGIEGVTFADKARRIVHLDYAAKIALSELETRPLLKEIRPTKEGDAINEAFNNTAMSEFRAALDDIAKELGERKNAPDTSLTVNVAERITFYLPEPEKPPAE